MKSISLIIPAYNEEKNIKPVYLEIKKVITPLTYKYNFEILFVNDGSRDNTISEIEKLILTDTMVKYIDFSRNFGKELATQLELIVVQQTLVLCWMQICNIPSNSFLNLLRNGKRAMMWLLE